MIGYVEGEVVFSDGNEVIIKTTSGIGYQIYFGDVVSEGSAINLYVSHIIREALEELYGFKSLRAKKLFELLLDVKGIGPKSAFALMKSLNHEQLIDAIMYEDKSLLNKVKGIGPKSAAQIILDLKEKIKKVNIYSNAKQGDLDFNTDLQKNDHALKGEMDNGRKIKSSLIEDTLLACKELGFREESILPLVQKILGENHITKSEQLVHLILKGM